MKGLLFRSLRLIFFTYKYSNILYLQVERVAEKELARSPLPQANGKQTKFVRLEIC